ncbi:ABC transporter substrate-binding protein, partial [Acinetobacter baumannii]
MVFNLRPDARDHDGRPITASDVAFSYRTLV